MMFRLFFILTIIAYALGAPAVASFTGQGTFYEPGLGACGFTNSASDFVVAISHILYDSYQTASADPNKNPLCGVGITATYNGKSVGVTVVDRCVSCAEGDLDFSPTAFSQLASQDLGRISGVTWSL
ncbi:hypothetical protein JAAARDRAFT_33392 [Jaapia argillacea MUCL 33604]|uniref:RlpA-like protein double-psi beta-barrel domain-containing protein n=1 Tax=Jaapia argillacea MUCL 33604 TaxID=933084 RepID=A0A067PYK2_9AGAM|nr:hypothetical protein JAAARDRAFT_33392 [Jaapia argillacea MUCL 33604]